MYNITEIPIPALSEICLFDIVIHSHGFEPYNRDYHFIVESGTTDTVGTFKIVFTHCFALSYRHAFADLQYPQLIRKSWGDELITDEPPANDDLYWWGQRFAIAYPGFEYDPDSELAKEMSAITQRTMYAVKLETSHYIMSFVFHDFKYQLVSSVSNVTEQVNIPVGKFKFTAES